MIDARGSIEIGHGNAIHAVMHATTIAALEDTITKCMQDGRPFLIRLLNAETTQVVSTIVSASTPVKIGYKASHVDRELAKELGALQLNEIITQGWVGIDITDHEGPLSPA